MKRTFAICLLVAASISTAAAQKMSLGDIPSVLGKLGGCTEVKSMFSGKQIVCERPKPWVAIHEDGRITIFYKSDDLDINGSGMTLEDALSNLARKATKANSQSDLLVKAIAPMLPTQ